MARQVITKLLDDLDGGDADETVSFAFDGSQYTIDLNAKNAAKFREFMSTYQEAGTRTGRAGQPPQMRPYGRHQQQAPTPRSDRDQNRVVREWAAANGYELSDRGRIPQSIVDAFDRKEPNPVWAAEQQAKAVEAAAVADQAKTQSPRKRTSAAKVNFRPERASA